MKLKQLTVEKLPGITQPLKLELPADRVAVVIGANASGKSSLIRAIKTLLDRKPKSTAAIISAVFDDGGRRIEGSALANVRKWSVDGQAADRPDWPDADQLDAYLIRADDLVDPGHTEQTISTELRKSLSGGVDLDALVNQAPFKTLSQPRGLKTNLEKTKQAIRSLEARYAAITQDVSELDDLRKQHQQSADAERRLSLLQRALEWLDVRQQISLTKINLDQLPEGLDRLSGQEAITLEAIERDQRDKQQHLEHMQAELKQAREALDTLQINDIEQSQIWRDDLATLQDHLQDASGRLRELNERRDDAKLKRELAARRSGGLTPEAIRNLTAERISQIGTSIDSMIQRRTEVEQLREMIALRCQHAADPEHADQIDQVITHLRSWLALPPARTSAWITWFVFLLATGGTAAWFLNEQQPWVALVVGVAGLMPLSHLIQLAVRSYRSAVIKSEVANCTLEPPGQWQQTEVQKTLRILDVKRAEIQRQQIDHKDADALRIKLEQAIHSLTERQHHLDQLADQVGLESDALIEAGRSLRLQNLLDWQQADAALQKIDSTIRVVENSTSNLIGTTTTCLQKLNPDHLEPVDANLLNSQLNRIDRNLSQARELRQRIQNLERSCAATQSDIEQLRQRRASVFEQADLDPGDSSVLLQRLGHLDEYKKLSNSLRGLDVAADSHALALKDDAQLTELVKHQDESGLLDLQTQLQAQSEQRETIKERISDVEHAYSQAMQGRELEALITQRETLRQQLLDALDQHRMARAGQFLLERIREEQHQHHQPAMLKRATHWFSRFTHSRYELKFDGQYFSAMDHEQGQLNGIAELSTATRVQLKLALRLAWIDQLDQHRPALPIMLDEVLATSDPIRYQAVVEAAQELVREGRQVVYLSAQPMDAKAWQHFADEPQPVIIQLGSIKPNTLFQFELDATDPIPSATLEPGDWAKQAGVAPINPWQADAAVDCFHVLRDELEQLNELRQRGIRSLGQLEHAITLNLIDHEDDLKARVAATKAWLQRWRLGQVRPINSTTLAESGHVTDAYIEGVTTICEHVNGDARMLIETLRDTQNELRVAGFGPKKIDALEDWLSSEGYLDEPEPARDYELIDALIQAGSLSVEDGSNLHGWLVAGLKQQSGES